MEKHSALSGDMARRMHHASAHGKFGQNKKPSGWDFSGIGSKEGGD